MKKIFKLLLASLLTLSLLVACGGTDNDKGTDEETKFKVVAVLDSGGIDDKSFNQSSWDGVQRFLKDNNLSSDHATYLTSKADGSDYVPNLDRAASEGADMVIAIGFLFEDAIAEVAPKHPETAFLFIDGFIEGVPNIHNTSFAEHEGSYLVGLIAGARAAATPESGVAGRLQHRTGRSRRTRSSGLGRPGSGIAAGTGRLCAHAGNGLGRCLPPV